MTNLDHILKSGDITNKGRYSQSESESCSVVSDYLRLHGQLLEFSRPEYWSQQLFSSPGDLPNPGIEPSSPTLQANSLPAELQEKPNSTGVGILSLLQQIFPPQESNWGCLLCRWTLYQLSHQGSRGYSSLLNSQPQLTRSLCWLLRRQYSSR